MFDKTVKFYRYGLCSTYRILTSYDRQKKLTVYLLAYARGRNLGGGGKLCYSNILFNNCAKKGTFYSLVL